MPRRGREAQGGQHRVRADNGMVPCGTVPKKHTQVKGPGRSRWSARYRASRAVPGTKLQRRLGQFETGALRPRDPFALRNGLHLHVDCRRYEIPRHARLAGVVPPCPGTPDGAWAMEGKRGATRSRVLQVLDGHSRGEVGLSAWKTFALRVDDPEAYARWPDL